jgi:hypothetical protein
MNQDAKFLWKFQVTMQSANALLKGTPHHLDKVKLCKHIEAGMNQVLYIQVTNAKCNEVRISINGLGKSSKWMTRSVLSGVPLPLMLPLVN